MGKYSCDKCYKSFSQKSHYDKHISRKNPCEIQKDKIKELIDKAVEEKMIELNKKLILNNTIETNITEQMETSKMSKPELLEKCEQRLYSHDGPERVLRYVSEMFDWRTHSARRRRDYDLQQ